MTKRDHSEHARTMTSDPAEVAADAVTGYLHPGYARSLAEFGTPRELERSGGWLLERAIPGSSYFDAMGILIVAGRSFDETDRIGAPVAIVNEAFARHFWPGQSPLGRKFRAAGQDRTVVGVTRTGKYNRLTEAPWPFFFLPYVPSRPQPLFVRGLSRRSFPRAPPRS